MIKANELRIGNWIGFKSTPEQYEQVKDLSTARPYVNRVSLTDVDPIPLTPEVLENAGFDNGDNNWLNIQVKGVEITFEIDVEESEKEEWEPNKITGRYLINGSWVENNIQYVHQFQNLIFCLTGIEPKITL